MPSVNGQAPPARAFSIGFLNEGSDLENAENMMEQLRRTLEGEIPVAEAMARAGYGEIRLSPCDGPRDMVQRMAQGEFELVFATAVVYARQGGPYVQPILQTRRPGDFAPPQGEGGVLRRGIVFIGPACPLFGLQREITPDEKRDLLARSLLAVPSSDSAAGYIYPRFNMAQYYELAGPAGFLFCGSDIDVVKHVVSGLLEVGACRSGALLSLYAAGSGAADGDGTGSPPEPQGIAIAPPKYAKELFQTTPFPTDPILMRNDLLPSISDLGRELKPVLRNFFNQTQKLDPGLTVEDASPRAYEDLARNLRLIEAPAGQGAPGQGAPAPAEDAAPAPTPRPPDNLTPALPPLTDIEATTAPAVATPRFVPVLPDLMAPEAAS